MKHYKDKDSYQTQNIKQHLSKICKLSRPTASSKSHCPKSSINTTTSKTINKHTNSESHSPVVYPRNSPTCRRRALPRPPTRSTHSPQSDRGHRDERNRSRHCKLEMARTLVRVGCVKLDPYDLATIRNL